MEFISITAVNLLRSESGRDQRSLDHVPLSVLHKGGEANGLRRQTHDPRCVHAA